MIRVPQSTTLPKAGMSVLQEDLPAALQPQFTGNDQLGGIDFVPTPAQPIDLRSPQDVAPETLVPSKAPAPTAFSAADIGQAIQRDNEGRIVQALLSHGDVQRVLENYGLNPETTAKLKRIARAGGIPIDAVMQNKGAWETWDKANQFYKAINVPDEDGNHKYPRLMSWLTAPENLAETQQSVETLKELEAAVREYEQRDEGAWKTLYRWGATSGNIFGKQIATVPATLESVLNTPYNTVVELAGMPELGIKSEPENAFYRAIDAWLQREMPTRMEKAGVLENLLEGKISEATKTALMNVIMAAPVVSSLPVMYGLVSAGALAGGVSATTSTQLGTLAMAGQMFVLGAAGATEGDIGTDKTPAQRGYNAILQGTAEMLFESLTTIKYLSPEYQMLLLRWLTDSKTFAKTAAAVMGKTAIGEFSGEYLTEIAQKASDYMTGNETGMENVWFDAFDAGVTGALMTGALTTPTIIQAKLLQAKNTKASVSFWDKAKTLVTNLHKDKISEDTIKEIVDAVVTNQQTNEKLHAFITEEELKEVFFKEADTPEKQTISQQQYEEFLAEFGLTPEVRAQHKTTYGALRLDAAVLLSKYGNDQAPPEIKSIAERIRKSFSFAQEAASLNELEGMRDELATANQELEDELARVKVLKGNLPKSLKPVREKLMAPVERGGVGLNADNADAVLRIYMALASTLSRSAGMSLEEFIAKNPVTFSRKAMKPGVLGSVTTGKELLSDRFPAHISLSRLGSPATAIHELAHYFLLQLERQVRLGNITEGTDAFAIYQVVRNALKITDPEVGLNQVDQEPVVRLFEKYIAEGNAPSLDLIDAFSSIRKWFGRILEADVFENIEISEELRVSFALWLATDRDLEMMEAYHVSKTSLIDIVNASEEVKQKARDEAKRVRRTAEERMMAKYFKEYVANLGGIRKLKSEALANFDKLPAIAVPKAVRKDKIALKSLDGLVDEETIAKLTSLGLVAKTKKDNILTLTTKHGFGDPTDFINFLLTAPATKEEIKQLKNTIWHQKRQEIVENLRKKVIGKENVDAELIDPVAFTIAEIEVLSDAIERAQGKLERPRPIEERAYRDAARQKLAEKKYRDSRAYHVYARQAQKLARLAFALAKEGRIQEALDLKKRQLMMQMMVQESVKLRETIAKAIDRYRPSKVKALKKNTEYSYLSFIDNVLYRYGFSPKKPDVLLPNLKKLQAVDNDAYLSLPVKVASLTASVSREDIVKRKKGSGAPYKDLTIGEILDALEALDTLFSMGTTALKSIQLEHAKTIQEVAEVTAKNADAYRLPIKNLPDKNTNKIRHFLAVTWSSFSASMQQMLYAADAIDAFSFLTRRKTGVNLALYNKFVDQEVLLNTKRSEFVKLIAPHQEVLDRACQRIRKEKGADGFMLFYTKRVSANPETGTVEGDVRVPLMFPERAQQIGDAFWTTEKMLAVLYNLGNKHNIAALNKGYGWVEPSVPFEEAGYITPQIEAITSHFFPEELEAVQGIWDALDTLKKPLSETKFLLTNRPLTEVQPDKVELIAHRTEADEEPTVTLQGGYYPVMYDKGLSTAVQDFDAQNELNMDVRNAVFRSVTPADGMVQDRVGSSYPIRLSLDVLKMHTEDTLRYTYLAPILRDMNRVTLNELWRDTYTRLFGDAHYRSYRNWIAEMASPNRINPDGVIDKGLDGLMRLTTAKILFGRFSTGIRQLGAVFPVSKEIGVKWLLEGIRPSVERKRSWQTSFFGLANSEAYQELLKLSPYIAVREKDSLTEVQLLLADAQGKKFSKWKQKGLELGAEWIKMNDRRLVLWAFRGAYHKYMQEIGKEPNIATRHEKAIKFAEQIVQQTQPSSLRAELAALQRSRGFIRAFMLFSSWSTKLFNRFGHNFAAVRAGVMSREQYFRHVLYEMILEPMYQYIVTNLTQPVKTGAMAAGLGILLYADDDWSKYLYDYLLEVGQTLTSGIPVVRDIARQVARLDGGRNQNPVRMMGESVPILAGPILLWDVGVRTYDAIAEPSKETMLELAWYVAKFMNFITAQPYTNFLQDFSKYYDKYISED